MRKSTLLALLVVVACAKEEAPAVDSAATAAMPPAPLNPADLAGTWNGTVQTEGDSVARRFTVMSTSDSTGNFVAEGSKDTVAYAMRYDADSIVATSAAYTEPILPKGTPQVIFRSVGRLKDGKLVGTSTLVLASKPDSVVSRSTWEATKAP